MFDCIEQFREAIRSEGITPPETINADGHLYRFSSNGKHNDRAGWYVLHGEGIPAGCFGDWRTGVNQNWHANIGRSLSPIEVSEHRDRVKKMQIKRQAEEISIKAEAQAKALSIWKKARPAPDTHSYLVKKGIKTHSAKLIDGELVIPLRDENSTLHSLQFINEDGEKRFLMGGRVSGCYFSIGSIQDAKVLCIAEGFSTGATVHEATDYPIAVAFNVGNLLAVATTMREKFPELILIFCADDDYKVDGNPGLTRATEAARQVNGLLAVPKFDANRPDKKTDFNDMAELYGLEAVQSAITNAIEPITDETLKNDDTKNWLDPLPERHASIKYPLEALGSILGEAAKRLAYHVQVPEGMAGQSVLVLAAAGLAAQGHINVQRGSIGLGPVSIFCLSVAESGDRKSTVDRLALKPIRFYENERAQAITEKEQCYRAEIEAWELRHESIIKSCKKPNAELSEDEQKQLSEKLFKLELVKPKSPPRANITFSEPTAEGIWRHYIQGESSAGLFSDEGISFFGGHGMTDESKGRTIHLLSKLWDGDPISRTRGADGESGTLENCRLTTHLMESL